MLQFDSSIMSRNPLMLLLTAILVLSLVGVAGTNILRARKTMAANACIGNLRRLDEAKQQWAFDARAGTNAAPSWAQLAPHLDGGQPPACPSGGTYTIGRIADMPTCSVAGHALERETSSRTQPWIGTGAAVFAGMALLLLWLLQRNHRSQSNLQAARSTPASSKP